MRIFILFIAVLFISLESGFGQTKTWTAGDKTFTNVDSITWYPDEPAQFPGGQQALVSFLGSNIEYPDAAQKNKIEGQVMARIVIHSNGTVSDIEIISSLGYGCDEEVLRVLSKLPKWKPAKAKGQKVASYFLFPVNFTLTGDEKQE